MSAEIDQAATADALLHGRYECIQQGRVVAFLDTHPAMVPLLEDLHRRLSTTFPGARYVLRHLSSPRVPSSTGGGQLLIVIAPAEPPDNPSGRLSDLLRALAPQQQAAANASPLVDVASAVVAPCAREEDVLALYVAQRSECYMHYLDAARRSLDAPPSSGRYALTAEPSTAGSPAPG